jgi:hypothetical protein
MLEKSCFESNLKPFIIRWITWASDLIRIELKSDAEMFQNRALLQF